MVAFNEIPGGGQLRIPLFFAELDASRSNLGAREQKTLIIGQVGTGSTMTAGVAVQMQGISWLKNAAGRGSMLALMGEKARLRDDFGSIWLMPLADDAAGTAATGTHTFTAAATVAGTLVRKIAGQRVAMAVSTTQTTAQLATAWAAVINGLPDLPVTASAATSVVTLTARNKGVCGNDIRTVVTDDLQPPGLVMTATAMTGGAGNPVTALTAALANMGTLQADFYAVPYTDTSSLDAVKAHFVQRWAWSGMTYGGAFGCVQGDLATVQSYGMGRNDPHMVTMAAWNPPEPGFIWAADLAATAAVYLRANPALPIQSQCFMGVQGEINEQRWNPGVLNSLLFSGLATHTVGDDGTVYVQRCITGYRVNAYSQPDDSLLDVERLYTIAAILRLLRTFVESTYPRMLLADDGNRAKPGNRVVTPSMLKRSIGTYYRSLEGNGLVQNADAVAKAIIVERDPGSRCRVNVLLPLVPIDQLRQVAVLAQLRDAVSIGGDL